MMISSHPSAGLTVVVVVVVVVVVFVVVVVGTGVVVVVVVVDGCVVVVVGLGPGGQGHVLMSGTEGPLLHPSHLVMSPQSVSR